MQGNHITCDVHGIINKATSSVTALQKNYADSQGNLNSALPFKLALPL